MKLALSALLVVLSLSQAGEAKTKIPATETKATTAEESRPLLDNKPTGGIMAPDDAKAAPAGQDWYNSPYPPAFYLPF
jgi:hypothetical protein